MGPGSRPGRQRIVILSGFRIPEIVSSPKIKNISLFPKGKSALELTPSCPEEGRRPSSPTLGQDAMDVLASGACERAGRKRQDVRRSRVVLTPRCWRQVLKKLTLLRGDGDNKPAPPGR